MARKRKQRMKRRFGSARQRGKRWIVQYTGPDGNRHTPGKSFSTEQQAEIWLAQEEALIDQHRLGYTTWTPPVERAAQRRVRKVTVGDYMTAFHQQLLDTGTIRTTTFQQYQRLTDNRVIREDLVTGKAGLLRDLPLVEVTRQDIQVWWDGLLELFPDTPDSNRKAHKRLRAAFADAMDRDLIPANPVAVKAAAKSAPAKYDKPLLEDGELFRVLDACPARYRALTVLTLFHGLRVGEAIGVRTANVLVEESPHGPGPWLPMVTVKVCDQLQRLVLDGKVTLVRQPTKTAAGVRDVPVFPEFVPVILGHLCQFANHRKDGLLTTTRVGSPVMDTSFRSVLQRAGERAGVDARVHPHSGRRWVTTRLAEVGASPREIGAVIGDTDLTVITSIYTSVRQSRPRDLMVKVGQTLGKGQGA